MKPHVPMIRFRKGGETRAGEASCGSAAVVEAPPSSPAGTDRGHQLTGMTMHQSIGRDKWLQNSIQKDFQHLPPKSMSAKISLVKQ